VTDTDTGLSEANRAAHRVARAALRERALRNTELFADSFAEWCALRERQQEEAGEAHYDFENALDEYERIGFEEEV
jgi:adenylosuccinate synthase